MRVVFLSVFTIFEYCFQEMKEWTKQHNKLMNEAVKQVDYDQDGEWSLQEPSLLELKGFTKKSPSFEFWLVRSLVTFFLYCLMDLVQTLEMFDIW